MILPCLFVAPSSKKGRGVFTSENLKKNTVIEISPVLVFSSAERKIAEQTLLFNYFFEWGKTRKSGGLGLGYISIYNHDYHANCDYDMDFDNQLMKIITVKDIKKGEELFINYNASPDDETPLWFDAK
jgi:uncharacterized protein